MGVVRSASFTKQSISGARIFSSANPLGVSLLNQTDHGKQKDAVSSKGLSGVVKTVEPNGHVIYIKQGFPAVIYAPPLKKMNEKERDETAASIFALMKRLPQADRGSIDSVVVDSKGLNGGNLPAMNKGLWWKQVQVFVNLPDLEKGADVLLPLVAKGVDARYDSSRLFPSKQDFINSYVDYYTGNTQGWPAQKKKIFSSGAYDSGTPIEGGYLYRFEALNFLAAHALFTDPLADLAMRFPPVTGIVNGLVHAIGNIFIR